MVIRHATPEDARAIAQIHVQSWQVAYQGIVPEQFLGSLSVDHREGAWRRRLEGSAPGTSVIEERGEVLGWISVGPSRDAGALSTTGELWALYVDPRHWRRGVGQRLWNHAEEHLRCSGISEVTVWVLKDNARALAFYHSSGFVIDAGAEKTDELGGAALVEVRLRKALGG
jgi:ribosomal protein S18 acetylase RimI-like enzyme